MSARIHPDSSPAFSGFFTFASQGVESQYFYNDLLIINVSGYQENISIGEISTVRDILSPLPLVVTVPVKTIKIMAGKSIFSHVLNFFHIIH